MPPRRTLTAKQKEKISKEISLVLNGYPNILFAYVFGSFAVEKSFKDIDIGIFISDQVPNGLDFELDLERNIEEKIDIPVDVRILNRAPLSFCFNVIKDKIVVLDHDDVRRSDFEGLTFKKYADYKHLRDEYLREIVNAPV